MMTLDETTLDDLALIQQFVRGDSSLAANQNLRIETVFNTTQLIAKRGKLLAKIERDSELPAAWVRQESEYFLLLHEALMEAQFTPVSSNPDERGFLSYQRFPIPEGYTINYTEARTLWKDWYFQRRNRNHIDIDLLVLVRQSWYAIRNISYGKELLVINTLGGDLTVMSSMPIAWLSRVVNPSSSELRQGPPTVNPLAQPLRRHFRSTSFSEQGEIEFEEAQRVNQSGFSELGHLDYYEPEATPSRDSDATPSTAQDSNDWIDRYYPMTSNTEDEVEPVNDSIPLAFNQIFRIQDGKLYIQTAAGEVIVEGDNLKFWLNPTPSV